MSLQIVNKGIETSVYCFTHARLALAFFGLYPQSQDLHWLKIIEARINRIGIIFFNFMKAKLSNVYKLRKNKSEHFIMKTRFIRNK